MFNKLKEISCTVIGGDQRQLELIKLILQNGGHVKSLGFPTSLFNLNDTSNYLEIFKTISVRLLESDIIFLPIPYKGKDGNILSKYEDLHIGWSDIADFFHYGSIVVLGKKDFKIDQHIGEKKIKVIDIVDIEEFSVLNAIPSAEGAIQKAMEHSPITLHGSKCLVLGYGRIGKILSHMLKGIGAYVTVEARKTTDLTWIEVNGYKPVALEEVTAILNEQDFIFNTIPYLILDRDKLEFVRKDALIIDLASAPGGTDFHAAKGLGIQARLDLGLPGLIAPKTAARIILDISLREFIKEQSICDN